MRILLEKSEVLKLSQQDFLLKLQTTTSGLTQKEAAKRLSEYGPNRLSQKGINPLKVFARQFTNSLIYLLLIATLVSYAIKNYTDGTVILVILLINTFLGFYQEYKSERIVEKLSTFITKIIRVKREGRSLLLDDSQIVPGDVVIVQQGDIVPADLRLLEANDLQVNESLLTGESLPVSKWVSKGTASVNDLLITGTTIEKGEGIGVAYATAKNSEFGKIAQLSSETSEQTEYEKSLKAFSLFLVKITLLGLAFVFGAKLLLNGGFSNLTSLLLFVISMAVAVVPEALPVIATLSLSRGSLNLAKKHVIVKSLSAVEDLGNVNLLCTDKTGTITENKMVIHQIVSNDETLFQKLAYAAITPLKDRKRRSQNSYDNAFLSYVREPIATEAKELTLMKELPFDPMIRRKRVILSDAKKLIDYLVVIGAPDVLLAIAHPEHKEDILHAIEQEDRTGLHHIALAYKQLAYSKDIDLAKSEDNLTFLGYVSLQDPLRKEAKRTLAQAEKLGLEVKILTGDSREVAEYVGKQVGLVSPSSAVFLADELDQMTPSDFQKTLLSSHVFARVSPTQKYHMIEALKQKYVVAYQGDGINDSPALKLADVAIAVNTATDIAKESSDIVLLNKSLEVIINGIKYGRAIFLNINKYIKFTMISNFGNFIALSVLYLISVDLPILPIQILLTTIVTDLPAIAISTDTVEDGEVIAPEKHNVRELIFIALLLGVPTALFELFYFSMVRMMPQPFLQTQLYTFFTLLGLVPLYIVRNRDHFWKAKRPSLALNISFFAICVLSVGMVYMPIIRDWFAFIPLPLATMAPIVCLVFIYLFAIDFAKVLYYRLRKR